MIGLFWFLYLVLALVLGAIGFWLGWLWRGG